MSLDQLRARFARNDGLPFADVLTEPRIRDALDEHGVRYRDRVFDPGHDHLGLPLPGPQRRPQLPRRRGADHRPPGGQRPGDLLAQHGQLLQRPRPPPHRRPAHPGAADRRGVAGRGRGGVEVERAERVHRRRVARLHARHAGEPGGLPAAGGAAAGDRLPPGPRRRAALAGDRRLPRPGHRPVRGQGHRRDHAAAADVRRADARRRGPGRRPVRQLFPRLRTARARHRAGRPRAGGAGGEPDGGGPARRRHHPLAAAQQAARDDGGAVPPLPEGAC